MTDYYVDFTNGSDSYNGLYQTFQGGSDGPWKTWGKVCAESIGQTFTGGDFILLKRGEVFEEAGYDGFDNPGSSVESPITIGAYGSGAKPVIQTSKDLSSTGSWSNISGSQWRSSSHTREIGNLIFDGGSSFGVNKSSWGNCTAQGHFYYDAGSDYVDLYSSTNPGTYYSDIRACEETNCITIHDIDYVTIQDIEMKYSASRGVSINSGSNYIIVERCDISYIGGAWSGGERYGNGIEVVGTCNYITVRDCTLDNIYDTALASENGADPGSSTDHYYYRNVVTNSWAAFAINAYSSASLTNCIFANNVAYGWGAEWSADQRDPVGDPRGFWWLSGTGTYTTCQFVNNILYDSEGEGWFIRNTVGTTGWTVDYNCYYPDADVSGAFSNGSGDRTLAQWQSDMSWDANSITSDPLFLETTTFRLHAGSPCADEGVEISGITDGFTGDKPDIGAVETYRTRPEISITVKME